MQAPWGPSSSSFGSATLAARQARTSTKNLIPRGVTMYLQPGWRGAIWGLLCIAIESGQASPGAYPRQLSGLVGDVVRSPEPSRLAATVNDAVTLKDSGPGNGAACRLPAIDSVYLSEGFGYELDCAPSTGTLNAFMFFVDFPDQSAVETTQSLYDVFLPDAASWYHNSSFGRLALNVTADLSRFYRMPQPANSYGWQRGLTSETHLAYIQDAIDALFQTAAATPDFSQNHVLYIVPTANATSISFSPTYMDSVASPTGTKIARKVVTFGHDAYATWHYKVLNHETGHTMCLPDLYPIDGRRTGLFVGGWDMMGYINGPGPDYFAWHKWKLGWLSDDQVDCITGSGSSTHVVAAMETANGAGRGVQAIVVKHNETSALVAEVRSTSGADAAACATGLLLYTVSTTTDTGEGPIKVLDTNPGSGGCAGDELNDAPLTLNRTSTYVDADWAVTVTVTGQEGDIYTVQVDVA